MMNELIPVPRGAHDEELQAIFKEIRILREQHGMMARSVKAMHDELGPVIANAPKRDGTMKKSLYVAGQIALMVLASIAVFLLIMAVRPAAAQTENYRPGYPSTAWVKECLTPAHVKGDNIHTCQAYIHGLINALAIWEVFSPETAFVCFPSGADFGKMRDQIMPQVRKEARDNISASQLLFQILAQQFPCRKRKEKEA
jgi:Rap1a immunity proteins